MVLEKVALDSMPGLRLSVIRELPLLAGNGSSQKIAEKGWGERDDGAADARGILWRRWGSVQRWRVRGRGRG